MYISNNNASFSTLFSLNITLDIPLTCIGFPTSGMGSESNNPCAHFLRQKPPNLHDIDTIQVVLGLVAINTWATSMWLLAVLLLPLCRIVIYPICITLPLDLALLLTRSTIFVNSNWVSLASTTTSIGNTIAHAYHQGKPHYALSPVSSPTYILSLPPLQWWWPYFLTVPPTASPSSIGNMKTKTCFRNYKP